MRRVGSTSNETMSTEDFLRGLFQNGDNGGGMDFRGAVGMPAAERAAQGRSTGWNEADHPRDDIGQFTFKEGGAQAVAGSEKPCSQLAKRGEGYSKTARHPAQRMNPWCGDTKD